MGTNVSYKDSIQKVACIPCGRAEERLQKDGGSYSERRGVIHSPGRGLSPIGKRGMRGMRASIADTGHAARQTFSTSSDIGTECCRLKK